MQRLLNAAIRGGEFVGAIAIALIAAIVLFDVIARALGAPTLWALEVTSYLMVAAALMAAGAVETRGEHFDMRLLNDRLPRRAARVIDLLVAVLTCAFVLAVAWGGFMFVKQSIAFGFRSATLLKVPLYLPQSLVAIGLTLLLLACALRFVARMAAKDAP